MFQSHYKIFVLYKICNYLVNDSMCTNATLVLTLQMGTVFVKFYC